MLNFKSVIIIPKLKTTCHASFHQALLKVSNKDEKVIIETRDNQTLKYDRVICDQDTCFGIQKIDRKKYITAINFDNMKSIKVKNKFAKAVEFTGKVIGVSLVVYLVVWHLFYNQENGDKY